MKHLQGKSKVIIVTENDFDARVLEKILDNSAFEIQSASGFSSALSKVRSLLTQTKAPILLLLDTETTDINKINDKKEFVDSYISAKTYKDNLKTIWAVPEFEIIFFKNKDFLETNLNKKISKDVWALAKVSPRNALEYLSNKKRDYFLTILDDKKNKEELRDGKIIKEILDFAKKARA